MPVQRSWFGFLVNATPAFLVIALGLFLVGCNQLAGEGMKFPHIEIVAPMWIAKVNVFPEESICVVESTDVIKQLIARWSHDYDKGWKRSYVALAPTYRVTVGTDEILVLRKGLAVVVQTSGGERVTYGRELPEGAAEQIVSDACSVK